MYSGVAGALEITPEMPNTQAHPEENIVHRLRKVILVLSNSCHNPSNTPI